MLASAILEPSTRRVNRTKLRQKQSAVLKKASGRTVVVVANRGEHDEKCILDKNYFDELLREIKAARETLEIALDTDLFGRLRKAAGTLEEDTRLGRLHPFEEVFGKD